MEIVEKDATRKGNAEMFVGDVWYDVIAGDATGAHMRVNMVRFAPGARTAWHAHAQGQTLFVVDGVGRLQSRDDEVLEVGPGHVIHTPAGEWHWHGAAPDQFMSHLAMWEAPEAGAAVEWGEHVSDDEYAGAVDENTPR
jgi:quercetin dioxygenase-like cupin family protein